MDVAQLAIVVDSSDAAKAEKALGSLSDSGDMVTGMVKKLIAAWSSWKVIEYARDAATLASRYETLGVVMGVVGNNAGYTRAQMDGFATALQQGGISMMESRNSLSIMAQAHIDLAKSTQLGRLAQDAAVVGNMNSSEAFHHMIEGIQSGRTEILRTIGINVNFEQGYKTMADSIGKTVEQLTEQEKVQARTNSVLTKAKDLNGAYAASMETAGKQLLSMARYSEDLQMVFGSLFSDAFGVVIQGWNQGLQDTKKWLVDNAEAARTTNQMFGMAASSFADMVKQILNAAGDVSKVNEQFSIMEILAGFVAATMAVIRDLVVNAIGAIQILWGTISTIVSGVLLGITKFFGMIMGFQPPKWMTDFYNSSLNAWDSGSKKLGSSMTAALISPDSNSLLEEAKADQAKRDKVKQEELIRINAGAEGRAADARSQADKLKTEAAKKYADMVKQENEALDKQRVLLTQGEVAAYKFSLAKQGIKGSALNSLTGKFQDNQGLESQAKSDQFSHDLLFEQSDSYRNIKYTLDPLAKSSLDYANAVYLINKFTEDGTEKAKLLKAAYDTMTPSGLAAAAAAKKLAEDSKRLESEASRMNYQYASPEVQRASDIQHLNEVMATGALTQESYNRRMVELDPVLGPLTTSMQNFGDSAADALAKWATGMDGAAIHWSNMIRSMMTDFARMMAQQGMNSLFGTIMGAIGDAWGSSSTVSAVNMSPNALAPLPAGPTAPTPYSAPASFSGGMSAAASVQVVINNNGAPSVQAQAPGGGTQIGRDLEAAVTAVIIKHQRPGGVLNPV